MIIDLAERLSQLGTRCVFGIPGEGASLELVTRLEQLGCEFHTVPHEAAGALMAGGYGRVSGIPGVALSIKGPGFSNLLSGIASNWLDRNPMLSLSESYGPGASPDRMHKRLAQAQMVRPVVKAYADNPVPDLLPKLWKLTMAEEPGPVHVDISTRLEGTSFEVNSVEESGFDSLTAEVTRRIRQAKTPVVIAGALASRRSWSNQLAALNIPVFTTAAAKGAIDETLCHAAGVFTNSGGPCAPESKILPAADLVVGLGLRTTEILDVRSLPAPLILLDELRNRAKGLPAEIDLRVKEDAFFEVIEQLKLKNWGSAEIEAARSTLQARLEKSRWSPAGCFHLLQRLLPQSTTFFLDTGSFCTIGEHALTARHSLHVLGSALGRSMGVGLPTAVGAAIAKPSRPVAIIVGDGGIRMYPEVISIAVQKHLPVLLILMADGSFASVRQAAVKKGLTQKPLKLNSPCWTRFFESFHCSVQRLESLAALENTVVAWSRSPQPLFVELAFDPEEYLTMTEGIR